MKYLALITILVVSFNSFASSKDCCKEEQEHPAPMIREVVR